MRTRAPRRWLVMAVSLAAAALACSQAESPITPAPSGVTPPAVNTGAATAAGPAATATPPLESGYPAPAATLPAESGYPGPAATLPPDLGYPAPAATLSSDAGYPAPGATPTTYVQPLPSDTAAPGASTTPIRVATATAPAAASPTATRAAGAAAGTPAAGPLPLPGGSRAILAYTVANEGGVVVGRPEDLHDGRETTWASLRAGPAAWVFHLDAATTIVGVRLYAQSDGGDPVTLTRIEVSADGSTWQTTYQGQGNCGLPGCDTLTPKVYTDIGFGAHPGQHVRLSGGPTRFAFAEVQIVVVP